MDWKKYIGKPDVVLNGKTPDGTRLVLLFAEDYKKRMGKDLDISCPKCFRNDFNNFINTNIITMSKTKSGFKVKKKYEGLTHPCSKNVLSTKAVEKDASIALEFYVEHPGGKSLFDETPKGIKSLVTKYSADKKKSETQGVKAAESEKKTSEEDSSEQ